MSAAFRIFNEFDEPELITVARVVELYLEHIASRVIEGTYANENYLNDCYYLRRFSKAHPLEAQSYTQADLENWMKNNPTWKSAHTKKGVVGRVVSCFKWAANPKKGNLIDVCPFERIESITEMPYVPRRAATDDEYAGLMREGAMQFKQGLMFIHRTGCRPCEMRELIWPWVNMNADEPHLRLEKHKTIRKTRKAKIIGLDEMTVGLLRYLRRTMPKYGGGSVTTECPCGSTFPHDPTEHVFTNTRGEPWTRRAFGSNLRHCAERAGLDDGVIKKVSAGCLRTKYACDLIQLGITNRQVADLLGHTTTDMVDNVYGAETRERAAHLRNMAKEAERLRKK